MMLDTHVTLSLRLLDWYREMGVDAAVGDEAIDWLAPGAARPGSQFAWPAQGSAPTAKGAPQHTVERAPARPALPPTDRPRAVAQQTAPASAPRSFVTPAPDAAVMAARTQAAGAQSIEELGQLLAGFDGCGLKATAKNLCFYRGARRARLMIVGEAPGREEDLAGSPFVGPAGHLLDKMLAAIGLTGDECHITNIVYWRPPGNRTPTPQETEVCRPFLERQTALVAPEFLLVLGAAAARQILATEEGIMRLRGRWRDLEIGGHPVRAMATLHPAYLLRTPAAKQNAWRDLLAVKSALNAGLAS